MPLPNTRAPVLLLRAPNGSPDPYEAALTESGYRPFSVPVLETVLVNGEELRGILKDGPSGGNGGDKEGERRGGYGGVIVTSSRAAEAWGKAVEEIANEVGSESEIGASAAPSWATTPFYAVGPSTAFALSSISSSHPSPTTIAHLCPTDIRGAYESGTAEKLAHFILHDIPESKRQHGKRLLYLTGDKNRETLPEILREGGLGLGSCKVYETRGSSRFEKELGEVVRGVDVEPDKPWWITYFAPSAAAYVTPSIRSLFSLPSTTTTSSSSSSLTSPPAPSSSPPAPTPKCTARIAAIGPTTADFLREELKLEVEVVPHKPGAATLCKAIAQAEGEGPGDA
ncbi:tetrapyrrole biosynthesis uroporphyrinogen III synthase [Stereum hirsutum FP-91666 SS1]|uniref:Tetrapyrrole biosynthesis uroporphyrinogen III synthase n=1 Tax=Stereum hirsutum (strain FP-91666) TaxID=721885 RepID=R7RXL7_STEHR|nr:tetrapyrrole biosynthesis uroporphyrinogen III synthase [Stereum hirsutum FP-91666 SS1]EIM80151.1 tetrapyrrole biosynthesis uroporphyrinogen III synthase [Stereum hirsutum FP-91666 SS1]